MSRAVTSTHVSVMTLVVGEAVHEVRLLEDLSAMSDAAASHVTEVGLAAVRAHGRFTICLSGGNSPQRLAHVTGPRTGTPLGCHGISSTSSGDERCVSLDRPDNHFVMASERFLTRVPIPLNHIHRMRGEAVIRKMLPVNTRVICIVLRPGEGNFPRFDLVLLGLGEDADTASLYPGTDGIHERSRLTISHYVPQRSQFRITLTFPVINNAAQVCFLVAGTEKAQALRTVLEADATETVAPARFIKPIQGKIVWFVDRKAASMLCRDDLVLRSYGGESSMKIVVAGGSGFIGSHVADALADAGHEVTIYDLRESPYLRADQRFVQGSTLDRECVNEVVAGQDVFYNFAGIPHLDIGLNHPIETVEQNILAPVIALEACRLASVRRYVYASSIYVYSEQGSFYRCSKQATELYVEEYRRLHGLDYTILRYGTV